MNDDLKTRFIATAVGLREKMSNICERDPMGDFTVRGEDCRCNRDRLNVLDRWIERLTGGAGK